MKLSDLGPEWREMSADAGPTDAAVFVRDDRLTVIRSRDDGRWHLSLSRPDRLPSWEDVKFVRDLFLPADVHFALPMPPKRYWINVHDYCLHLWEIHDPITEQWEYEGMLKRAAEAGLVLP